MQLSIASTFTTLSQGSFFQNVCYKQITDQKDVDFAVYLTKELGVASIPISVFYHECIDEKVLRFCFAKDEATLQKAGEMLSSL